MEKIIDKIKKLLALAESANPHEAELAAARAAELMARHQIDSLDHATEVHIGDFVVFEARAIPRWKVMCAGAASAIVGGDIYLGYTATQRAVYFVGRHSDLATVQYMFNYFCREVKRLSLQGWIRDGEGNKRSWLDSFRKGAGSRLWTRAKEARRATMSEYQCEALIRVDQLQRAVNSRLAQISGRVRTTAKSSSAAAAGRDAADRVRLGGAAAQVGAARKMLRG